MISYTLNFGMKKLSPLHQNSLSPWMPYLTFVLGLQNSTQKLTQNFHFVKFVKLWTRKYLFLLLLLNLIHTIEQCYIHCVLSHIIWPLMIRYVNKTNHFIYFCFSYHSSIHSCAYLKSFC